MRSRSRSSGRPHRRSQPKKSSNPSVKRILFKFSFGRHFGDRESNRVTIWCHRQGDRTLYTSKGYGSSYSLKELKSKIWLAVRTRAGD